MDLWEVKFSTPDENVNTTGFVRADNAAKAVIKILETTPGLTNFYKVEVKERPDAFLVTEN